MACHYMSYLEQGPDLQQPLASQPLTAPSSSAGFSSPGAAASAAAASQLQALPSTRASAQVVVEPAPGEGPSLPSSQGAAAAGAAAVSVPRIVFLYKLASGIADRSFGAPSSSLSLIVLAQCFLCLSLTGPPPCVPLCVKRCMLQRARFQTVCTLS